jgi:hypothetical protein
VRTPYQMVLNNVTPDAVARPPVTDGFGNRGVGWRLGAGVDKRGGRTRAF